MTPARLKTLLEPLPPIQRATAQKKIEQAIKLGWDEDQISLDTPQDIKPHHYDLMGTHPEKLIRTLLPEPSE